LVDRYLGVLGNWHDMSSNSCWCQRGSSNCVIRGGLYCVGDYRRDRDCGVCRNGCVESFGARLRSVDFRGNTISVVFGCV